MGMRKRIKGLRNWCPQPPDRLPTKLKTYSTPIVVVLAATLIFGISFTLLSSQFTMNQSLSKVPVIETPTENFTQASPTPSTPTPTPTPNPRLSPTLTPSPYITPTPTPMPGLPSPPPPYLSLSINPSTVHINEEVFGNITTNIHDFNATVTYSNTQTGEAKQIIVPCENHSGQFSVVFTKAGSYSFIAEFDGKSSNTVQISVT